MRYEGERGVTEGGQEDKATTSGKNSGWMLLQRQFYQKGMAFLDLKKQH